MRRPAPPPPKRKPPPLTKPPTKQDIVALLNKFKACPTAGKLLGNFESKLTIISVGTGTGGAAQGSNVTIDVKKNKTSFMSVKEAAESAIFEFQNTKNASENTSTKNGLGTTYTLKQYGVKMAQTEFKSTKAVQDVLTEYKLRDPSYVPSTWGQKQLNSSATAQTYPDLVHDANKKLPSKFALKSWELYAYEAIENTKLLSKVVKKMATLKYRQSSFTPAKTLTVAEFLPAHPVKANNIDSYLCCVELVKLLNNKIKQRSWTVTSWNIANWDFTADMIRVTGKARPKIPQLQQKFQSKLRGLGVSIRFT